MRYAREHKDRTRARVLTEAAAAIRRKGAQRVAVAEVMAAAGLTHGGFYAHFESKDELVAEAITHMFEGAYARYLRETEGREPKEALSRYVDFYLSQRHCEDRSRGCPLAALSSDLPNLPERARARFTDGTERMVGAVAKLLEKLGAADPEALAWSVFSEMSGALSLSRAVADPARAGEILGNSRASVKTRIGLGRVAK